MSNCVHIHSTLVLPLVMFDVTRLDALCRRVVDLKRAPEPEQDHDGYLAWWFLTNNSGEVIYLCAPGSLRVPLGAGRSIHTDRDLRHLMLLLCRHMQPAEQVLVSLRMADEYDGFASEFIQRFYLCPAADYESLVRQFVTTPQAALVRAM